MTMAENDAAGRGKGRPKAAEAGEIDLTIRAAAMDVLRESGEAATLNAVAVMAGLSRKTVYARYPTKADLFGKVIADILGKAEPLRFDRGADFEASLTNYVRTALQSIVTPGAQAVQRLIVSNPEYMKNLRREMQAAMHTIFALPLVDLLSEAEAAGHVMLSDRDFTVRAIMKLILLQDAHIDGDPAALVNDAATLNYARSVTRLICDGIVRQA